MEKIIMVLGERRERLRGAEILVPDELEAV